MQPVQEWLSKFLFEMFNDYVNLTAGLIGVVVIIAGVVYVATKPKLFMLGLKNLRRHIVRTVLTAMAIAVLAFMITTIWTVIYFIDLATRERAKDLKIIVTERWQIPSQLPSAYAKYLDPTSTSLLPELQENGKPKYYAQKDFMSWSFFGGSLDPNKRSPENLVFFFAMNPDHIMPMMDDLGDIDPKLIDALKNNLRGCLMGSEKMQTINKRVGERFKLASINYKGIDNVEFEIVGVLPDGRYNQSAIMNNEYFYRLFDDYKNKNNAAHPLAVKNLNLIWIRVSDREQFDRVGNMLENSPYLKDPSVKVETASSGISSFLDAYKDLLLAMKYLLVPGMMVVMSLVMANAISITVRERRMEMAVMKVLGYSPNQVLMLVLGEAMLIGAIAGFAAALTTYLFFNLKWGGIPFRIAFFPVFRIPEASLFWGLAIGSLASFAGSILPAWSAREVKVSEVFSKVA